MDSLDTNSAVKNDEENPQDFNGNQISEADFIATTVTKHPIGTISSSQNVNFTNGHYQTVTLKRRCHFDFYWLARNRQSR